MKLNILAIESSCDETSAAVVVDGREVLSNIIESQIPIHKEYGGVVPEIASRNHLIKISSVVQEALNKANLELDDIDKIAVTYGPGLVGALLVGVNYAKALAYAIEKPLVAVNHLLGHLSSPLLTFKDLKPPYMSLVVSGGHTYLARVHDYTDVEIVGETRDDAIGEAYDKVARTLGFEYPGGPKIDKAAKAGDRNSVQFPRVFLEKDSLDFSFSGIKSAVLNHVNSAKMKGLEINAEDISASFQEAVLEVLVEKSIRAVDKFGYDKLVVAGGVAANTRLREMLDERSKDKNLEVFYPDFEYCTDNAAMIGSAGFYLDEVANPLELNAMPGLGLKAL